MLNTHWDLSVIYKDFDDPALEADFAAIDQGCDRLTEQAKAAAEDPAAWIKTVIEALGDLAERSNAVGNYIFLTLAVDATNARALAAMDRINNLTVKMEMASNAVSRRLAGFPDLDGIIDGDDRLAAFRFVLREMADKARHMLPENLEEPVLSMQLTGGRAWEALRNVLDGTAMVDYRGEKLPLPAVRGKAYDADPQVRKDAYEAELAAYPAYETAMAAALNALKGEAITMARLKGYDSVLDQVLELSRMDRATLDALMGAIEKHLPAFRRYLKAKARYLGYEGGLPFYDLFAPIGETHTTYTYDQAHEYLVKILGRFSDKMGRFIDEAFTNRWIDALPAPGKGGGAFCSFVRRIGQSRVMSNFNGSFSDVSTLAHELGHAYHGRCLRDEEILNTEYPMPLAETASIFNETLVVHAALETADPRQAFTLLEGELMEATQVIVDIYSRYLFETAVFEARKERSLSVEELKNLMLDAQKKAYGDGLDPRYLHPYMWQCKSHYYTTDLHFYNFPYAFGLLFGRGVYALYQKEGAGFTKKYDALLRGTGVHSVADTAKLMDIDVRDISFWETSLASIEKDIDRFVDQVEAGH